MTEAEIAEALRRGTWVQTVESQYPLLTGVVVEVIGSQAHVRYQPTSHADPGRDEWVDVHQVVVRGE